MSLNTCHASQGVLLHAGEYILLHSSNIVMKFTEGNEKAFKGSKKGQVFLSSHRIIFLNKNPGDLLQSFSAPFIALFHINVEHPLFGPTTLTGKARAQPHGNFEGTVGFRLEFRSGGAVEYARTLKRVMEMTKNQYEYHELPAYSAPEGWTQVAPPAYEPPPGYYEWLAEHPSFTPVPPNIVFMSTNCAPYPGIGAPPPYIPAQDPIPIPTGTPCAKYKTLSSAPAALGYRNEPIGRGCCHNTNEWETIA